MDKEKNFPNILGLFEVCEEIEKKEKALKILKDWIPFDVIEDIEKKIERFKREEKVFITKKFRLNDAHKDLLPFMRLAQYRALEKIRDMGVLKDEDQSF